MKYNIRGDKMLITDAIKDYTETKLGKLEKYFKENYVSYKYLTTSLNKTDSSGNSTTMTDEEKEVAFAIRRNMNRDGNIENITETLINMLSKTKNNKEFMELFIKSEVMKK